MGPTHSVRLRDGDRELEVSGSAAFVRQIVDELPEMMARLRGERGARPASIRMPQAPEPERLAPGIPARTLPEVETAPRSVRGLQAVESRAEEDDDVDSRVLGALEGESRGLTAAAIREKVGDDVTGQQVRRILERAGDRVRVSRDRPAVYRLR